MDEKASETPIKVLKEAAQVVLSTLREHGASSHVSGLEQALAALDDPAKQLAAAEAFRAAAHPRALGDIFIEEIPGNEWPMRVSRLGRAADEYIKEHDSGATASSSLGYDRAQLDELARRNLPAYTSPQATGELEPVRKYWPNIVRIAESPAFIKFAKFVLIPVAMVGGGILALMLEEYLTKQ